jgi:serine phosphatase RsbU (regulator of sigma subunit)/anti-sigma regulatory factor (Ser/Thr protein kinase)
VSQAEVVSSYLRSARIVTLAGVPLIAETQLVGVVHVGSKRRREFDDEDILLLQLVAARAAVAIVRAREHEREHRIAEILQRSLLPERLPAIEHVEVAARYVPGAAGVAVGGDWYDVFELPGGSIGVAVGDVVGHGARAAAAMGRLRHVLRAYAFEGHGPAETLSRVNRLACETVEETFGTIVLASIGPTRTSVRLASAGHPPVLVRSPDGAVETVEGGRSVPVGATAEATYSEIELYLAPGSTLVLYTDGLVERRGESIDAGIGRLIRLVADTRGPLDELADTVIAGLEDADHSDDVVVLVVQPTPVLEPRLSLRFAAEPGALAPMRADLRTWLEAQGASPDDVFDMLVAVNEACTNAVEHPLDSPRAEVTLEAERAGREVSIVISNPGRWRPQSRRADRGRGLVFMRALMDDVEVQRSDSGTSVLLRRRLRRTNGADA